MRAPLQRLPTKALLDCICGAAYPPPACAYSHPLTALLRSISPGTFHGAVPISHRCASTAALGDYPAAQPRRVVVTGLGAVTPLGVGTIASWGALLQGRTGVRRLKPEDLPEEHRAVALQLPCQVVARVPQTELAAWRHAAAAAADADPRRTAPFMAYALAAASEAVEDAGLGLAGSQELRQRTGVAIGTGLSCPSEIADAGRQVADGKQRKLSPFFVPRILNNMAAGAVGIRYGLQGPNHAVSTACATGVHAIGDAFRMIQRGDADAMIAGGAEACIDAISLAGFSRLRALSTAYNDTPERASRPFDSGRDGFVMGEGAGIFVLEEREAALARGAKIYAEVRGYGLSGDGHHVTQPHPEGVGAALAMRRALHGSGVDPSQVAYINAHATSTPLGDQIELSAIEAVFGAPAASGIAVSSTKGATGHLLGAAGAVESLFTVLALHHRVAPANVNLDDPVQAPVQLVRGAGAPLPKAGVVAALCNSFGFGGTNASILFAV